ncbi:MAG: PAS domain S-box protein [Desulfobacterales bacterium]|nr:PAS domain S-box protein [Desulfobacterales bacterium]
MTGKEKNMNLQSDNISDIKQNQDEIMNSLMNSPIGIYIIQDRKFSRCNAKFQEITGYTEKELADMVPMNMVLPEDKEKVRENAVKMLKGERKDPYQFRVLDKAGDIRWIIESVAPITHEGRPAVLGNFMDITESEGIRTSFMNSPIGIYIIQNKKFLFSNAKFGEITGYTEEELVKKKSLELVLPEDREHVRKSAIKMMKGKLKDPYQFRIVNKSGELRWVIESVAPIRYEDKRSLLGNMMDVTENEMIKNSFMSSPVGIYIVRDGKCSFSNSRFQYITRYADNELKHKHILEIVLPEDRDRVRSNAVQMLKGKRIDPYQFRILTKDGEIRWIMEKVSSIHYKGRRAVLGSFMDITESKRIESELLESEEKYRSLFELAREGIVIANYADGSILDFNSEFLRQTDYTPEVLRERKIWEIQPYEFQEEARETFFRFKETGGGIMSWKLCQRSGGNVLPVEIAAQHITLEGKDVILCMVRDISEREAMMRALRHASEEWRKSFDAIDDAVVLINPDFRIIRANLAAARILGMDVRSIVGKQCHYLFHGSDVPPDYCPQFKAQAKGIFCEAEANERYLGRTLHFSSSPIKDDNGKITHTVEIISDVTIRRRHEQESARLGQALAESFQGITESLSDLAESRDPYTAGHSRHVAKLAVLVGKEMGLGEEELHGLRICAILHDIGKVIIPAGILNKPGRLSEHEWGLIRAHPTTAYETLRHIPFPWPVADVVHQHHERLDGSGYPLGLKGSQIHMWARIITVADMVDAMTSHRPYRPGLPRQNALNELKKGDGLHYDTKAVEALMRVIRLNDRRVMVIDDEDDVLEALVEELKAEGLDATGHTDPARALQAFAQKPFPLVITDLNMPEMDGAQLARKMKEINSKTKIIIITGYGGKEAALRALRAGVSDFLEKPLDLEILRKSVNRALQSYGKNDAV